MSKGSVRKRVLLCVLAAVSVLGAVFWARGYLIADQLRPRDYAENILKLMEAGDYDGAFDGCLEGLRKFPESAELYILKARIYACRGDMTKAAATLDFGYKQTGSGEILKLRSEYPSIDESGRDYGFFPADVSDELFSEESASAGGDTEAEKTFTGSVGTPYDFPEEIDVDIPEVRLSPKTENSDNEESGED